MAPRPTGITRRGLMGAMGGALAGGALTSSVVDAAVPDDRDANGVPLKDRSAITDVVPLTAAPIDHKYSYLALNQFDFRASDPTKTQYQGPYYFSAPGWWAAASLKLPAGTRIRKLTVCAANGTGSSAYFTVNEHLTDGYSSTDVVTVTVPAGSDQYTPITVDIDLTIKFGATYSMFLNCADSSVGIASVLVGYENTGSYVPVTPYRCYDSRFSVWGKVNPNTGRVLDTTVAINTSTGAQVGTDMIPATARAVTFNLQAVGATGANNFAITNGDALVAAASHIVFNSSTPTVANAGTVDVADGYVKIFGGSGPGAAHCILDITGYYV